MTLQRAPLRGLVAIALLAPALAAPGWDGAAGLAGPAAPAAGTLEPHLALATVHGTARDVLGAPVQVVVCAVLAGQAFGVPHGAVDATAVSDAAGQYALAVPPGDYWVYTTENAGGTCTTFYGTREFVHATHRLLLAGDTQLDFDLAYHVAGWVGGMGASGSAGRPGDEVGVFAVVGAGALPVEVAWEDDALGAASRRVLAHVPSADRVQLFRAPFAIPEGRPDGAHGGTLVVTAPGGLELGRVATTSLVDTVAPVIQEVFPADGAAGLPATRYPWFRAVDDRAGVDGRSSVQVWDVTLPGQRDLAFEGSTRPQGDVFRTWDRAVLAPGRTYEARFTVRDAAGNAAEATSTFATYPGGPVLADTAPTGTTGDAFHVVGATLRVGPIDASRLVATLDGPGDWGSEEQPFFDPATGRFWLEPALDYTAPGKVPPLIPGSYRVHVMHADAGANTIQGTWTFQVEG